MKKFTIIVLLFLFRSAIAQSLSNSESFGLNVSFGSHAGLWNSMSFGRKPIDPGDRRLSLPFNLQIEKLLKKRIVLGVAFSYDELSVNPSNFTTSRHVMTRQNLRIRYLRFNKKEWKNVRTYTGASIGLSYWTTTTDHEYYEGNVSMNKTLWPTAQFIFGLHVKLSESVFSQTEFCIGPPYALQSSIGISF